MIRWALVAMLCILGVSSSSFALDLWGGRKASLDLYLLNTELRFERGAAQELVSHTPNYNFAFGGRYKSSELLFELASFTQTSGNATLAIQAVRHEYVMWWKEYFYDVGKGDFFVTAGLGAYQEQVQTALSGSSITDRGETTVMGGLGIGFGMLLMDHLLLSIEGRAVFASNFDPNPSPGILFRSGFEF